MGDQERTREGVPNESCLLQNRFRRNLYRYINGEFLSWQDTLVATVAPSFPFNRRSRKISRQYVETFSQTGDHGQPKHLAIEAYEGKNRHVRQMMERLSILEDDLVGAYVHGSLGTNEETYFSDFDALVIIKDSVLRHHERLGRVAYQLYSAQSIMFDFDPIQHHGWVVLSEADLKFYPEDRFPSELFRYAKSLYLSQGRSLTICSRDSQRSARFAFESLCQSVVKRITRRKSITNVYELKILLSQFMLLPSMYVEMRDGKGIYKKFSFEAARDDFAPEDWSIMDDVSTIRKDWHYRLSPLWRSLMTKPSKFSRYLVKRHSPSVPRAIQETLTDDFFRRMEKLISRMRSKVA